MPRRRSPQPTQPDGDLQHLALPGDSRVLLASDMHLGEHDPATARFFIDALAHLDGQFTHLILLGDLFEAWVGDDQTDPVALGFIARLAAIAERRPVYVMRGNRDFLLNLALPGPAATPGFGEISGATMLADFCTLAIDERQWLLAHGDSFCTDDLTYQAFRRESRQPSWIAEFLSQPLSQRAAIAHNMREQSRVAKSNKPENLTDVNRQAVQTGLERHGQHELIHGHTHRPDHHHWQSGDSAFGRHVLPDWDAQSGRGGFFVLDADGLHEKPPATGRVSQPSGSDPMH